MNYYSAHLFIDVHCSLKQKKKKKIIFYSAGPHCLYFLFILSNLVIHSLSFSLSLVHLSFLSSSTLSMSSPSSSSLQYGTTCFFFFFSFFFFFFHFIKSGLIHSLSFTVISHLKPLKLTLSTSPPSSSSLRSLKLTLSTSPARPSSTSPPSSSLDPRRRSASNALLFRRSTSGQLSLSSSCDALGF